MADVPQLWLQDSGCRFYSLVVAVKESHEEAGTIAAVLVGF